MSTIKKRQHYVWRYYLKPWTNNGNIWTYLKKHDKIIKSGLMKVAQEKYFYELVDLTKSQKAKLKYFIDETSHPSVKPLVEDFFKLFTSHNSLRRKLQNSNLPKPQKEKLSQKLKEIKINSMENVHSKFEHLGRPLLNCSSISDLKKMTDDELVDTMMFICVQFMRTRARKEAIIREFQNTPYGTFAQKSWNIISFVMALNMAHSLFVSKDLCLRIYKNNTSINFLTGNQPLFNTLKNETNENGRVEELELYYPLSPTTSLLIYFDVEDSKFQERLISKEQVESYNKLISDSSYYFVFSNNKKQLNKF